MDCSEFLERFSELEDGLTDRETQEAAEAHLQGCGDCRRYRRVFRRGVDLLRSLESPSVREDFRPRLQHRIYHLEDGEALDRSGSSATTVFTALGMTALLSFAAWSPALRGSTPEVEAPPVAARPAETPPPAADRPGSGLAEGFEARTVRSLLHHYSSFGQPEPGRSSLRLIGSSLD